MAVKRPAFQFYPADWRKDVQLRACSIEARGLWIELMCVAHECQPYGHLALSGKPMTSAQIAGQVGGATPAKVKKLLDELIENGVARVSADGVVFSARMVRDERVRNLRAEGGYAGADHGQKGGSHGHKGGRPRKVKGGFETPDQTPLDADLKPSPSSSSSSSSSDVPLTPTAIPQCPHQEIVSAYHEELPELPRIVLMDAKGRRDAMQAFWKWVLTSKKSDGYRRASDAETALAWIRGYFQRASQNDFVMGRTRRSSEHSNWRADLDYLISERGRKQVIEKTNNP